MLDTHGRDIDYLRISVTDKCNLRCRYCMPESGIEYRAHAELLTLEEMAAVARAAVAAGFTKIRLTGGEPLVKRGIVDLVAMIADIEGLVRLGMTTNGTLLASMAPALWQAGLRSLNVSLDTLDAKRYRRLTRCGNLADALEGIRTAAGLGFALKINMVVLEDTTEAEIAEMREFCGRNEARLQLIGEYDLASLKQDRPQYDRPPVCSACNRLRLTADGMLRPCLHSDIEIGLDPADIAESLRQAIAAKPACGSVCTGRGISQIGG